MFTITSTPCVHTLGKILYTFEGIIEYILSLVFLNTKYNGNNLKSKINISKELTNHNVFIIWSHLQKMASSLFRITKILYLQKIALFQDYKNPHIYKR